MTYSKRLWNKRNAVTNGLQGIQDEQRCLGGLGLTQASGKNGGTVVQGRRSGKAFCILEWIECGEGEKFSAARPTPTPARRRSVALLPVSRESRVRPGASGVAARPSIHGTRTLLAGLACEVPTCEQGRSGRAIVDLREVDMGDALDHGSSGGPKLEGKAERRRSEEGAVCAGEEEGQRRRPGRLSGEIHASIYVCLSGPAECR
jgi:hypothetical protein